jgi:Cu+-exporting ATPase
MERGLEFDDAKEFESHTGTGVTGQVGERRLALGNQALMSTSGASISELESAAEELRNEGGSVMYLAIDGKLAAVADAIKPTTRPALEALRKAGIHVVMASGDAQHTAEAVGRELGIDDVRGEVRPKDKAELVKSFQDKGHRVAMAGDGINAPGAGSSGYWHAMGAADVACRVRNHACKGDLGAILRAEAISITVRNMKQSHLASPTTLGCLSRQASCTPFSDCC